MSEHLQSPLPWQKALWHRLSTQLDDNKLPHALLLAGSKGVGKSHFAEVFSRLLVCLSPVNQASCGSCKTCLLMKAGSHPDYLYIHPEEKSKVIKIDQIRLLTEFLSKTAQQGRRKVAIIEPAENLNLNAANALLKSLEEPAGETTLLLISHMPSLLMATIRSRCQKIDFPLPPKEESLRWLSPLVVGHDPEYLLDCAGGAPFVAKQLLEGDQLEQRQLFTQSLLNIADQQQSPLDVAAKFQSGDPLVLVEMMLGWMQLSIKATQDDVRPHNAAEQQLIDRLSQVSDKLIFRLMDKLMQTKRHLMSGSNPNKQLLLEEMLMDWQALLKQSLKQAQARHSLLNDLN